MKKTVYTEYEYTSPKVGKSFDNYRMVLISDLHSIELGKDNCNLVSAVKNAEPDIIIAAGDMVSDHGRNMRSVVALFAKLVDICPVFYSPGNHEYKLNVNPITHEKYRKYKRTVRKLGVRYLINRSVRIKKNEDILRISGLNIDWQYYNRIWNKINMPFDYISTLLKPCKDKRLELLIAHNPDYFEQYAEWGADIVMSGHIHGGIAILPFFGGVIAPTMRLFPYYDFGVFNKYTSTMYLTRGLGAHTIPVRIFNPPEIMIVTLRANEVM